MNTKRKKSITGYTQKNWILKKTGIGIVHTMLWLIKAADKKTKIKITIEEI